MLANDWRKTCNLSCQNSFSFALSKNGNSRTWCTKMYRKIGRSLSNGDTSPKSLLKGAPKRWRAVGELSSVISNFTCWEMSSRFKSKNYISMNPAGEIRVSADVQCSCFPVRAWPWSSPNGDLWATADPF